VNEPPARGPRLTDEQARALAVSGASVALSAGAGCGKTTVLAERFLRALDGPDPVPLGRVVALTFTNKAARELRDRIRRECRGRLEAGGDPAYWRSVIRGLAAARIGTFHSFCGEVLRRHAIEAGVDPGFVVLDEPIALALRDQALAVALRERLAARDRDLIDLAVEFGLGPVRQALGGLLANRSGGDIRAWAEKTPRDLVDLWVDRWTRVVRPAMIAGFSGRAAACAGLLDPADDVPAKIRDRMGDLGDAFARLSGGEEPDGLLATIADLAKVQGLAAKLWPSAEAFEAAKDLFTRVRTEARKLREALAWDERTSMDAAAHGLRFARLAARARAAYDLAKRARGGVDNDDLLTLTRDLLVDRPGTVGRALAGSVDLVLVDEFQDTDPVQGQILENLGGDGLIGGRLFLVGDTKQSIYRFRGAKPDLFRDYRDRFPAGGRLDLTENFRSVPAVLDFVNALFAATFTEPGAALVPGGVEAVDRGGEPAVAFLWGDPPATLGPGGPKPDADARRRDEARRLARHLKGRLDAGWTVRDKQSGRPRRADAGDVAFLFRSLSDAANYESALVAEGLDYHVVGGSGFFLQQEVLDLINVLTAVEDPLDAVALAGTLRSPFFSISDDALYWIATERKGAPHEGLDRCEGAWLDRLPEADRPRAARARLLLAAWREAKDRAPIAALLDRILDESGYEAALVGEFLGDRKRANARKLVRMARRFDEQGGFTLADFVERLRADLRGATKETQAATTDEQGQIIRLMSIHQSKGLEFPIVVLPDLDRKRPGELRRVAFDPDLGPLVNPVAEPDQGEAEGEGEAEAGDGNPGGCLGWSAYRFLEKRADDEEALRLFYVATTRARDFLVLSSATDAGRPPTSPALALLDRRFDRATGRLKVPLPDGWAGPVVEVIPPSPPAALARPSGRRPGPRLADVARVIGEAARRPGPEPAPARAWPRLVDLDPAAGLSSTSARLDRLIRAILADPHALDPSRLRRIADRAARSRNPVTPPGLVDRAVDLLTTWARTPLAREIARSAEVRRGFTWAIPRAPEGRSTLFQGRGDFLFRDPSGQARLVILSDPQSSGPAEQLRLLLSARAAEAQGFGPVRQAWHVHFAPTAAIRGYERFDDPEIDRAAREWFAAGEA